MKINTICETAKCPNIKECFSKKTVTFLIFSTSCTRNCKFCNVGNTKNSANYTAHEPEIISNFVKRNKMKYVVLTSPSADNSEEFLAKHYINVISEIHKNYNTKIEVLVPDFNGNFSLIDEIVNSGIDVFAHNIETVPRLYKEIRPKADYKLSLSILRYIKEKYKNIFTKTGLIIGLGETKKEIFSTIKDIKSTGCDILTIGQYFPPTINHYPLRKVYTDDEFVELENYARSLEFLVVSSGTYIRSSYKAEELFKQANRCIQKN